MRRGVGQWVALRNDQLLDVQYGTSTNFVVSTKHSPTSSRAPTNNTETPRLDVEASSASYVTSPLRGRAATLTLWRFFYLAEASSPGIRDPRRKEAAKVGQPLTRLPIHPSTYPPSISSSPDMSMYAIAGTRRDRQPPADRSLSKLPPASQSFKRVRNSSTVEPQSWTTMPADDDD